MSPIHGERELKRGQEVITAVIGSATILNAILRLGLVPVFVDTEIPTYNANPCLIEEAVNQNTGAIFLQHVLGNPVSVGYIEDHAIAGSQIWSVYDGRHSIGGNYTGTYEGLPVGSYGSLCTISYYSQAFEKERGVILTDSSMIYQALKCSGEKKTQFDCTCTVMKNKNWQYFHDAFKVEKLDKYFILPEAHRLSDPNWFGFCLTCRKGVDRERIVRMLRRHEIRTHSLPIQDYNGCKMVGVDRNVKVIRDNSFWISVHPSVSKEKIVDVFKKGFK
jgi:CDP-6-deoxy-D-xylo-4-hexulose-3-dehydrase